MSRKNLDRRIQKTLQLLEGALAGLIVEKEYEDITVREILDRANVGRSTFYAHFENKDHLLRHLLTHLYERFDQGIRQLSEGENTLANDRGQTPLRVLQFVEQNQELFQAMLLSRGRSTASNPFSDYLFALTQEHLKLMLQHEYSDSAQFDMTAHYYAGAFIGALEWWLENDMACSAEELAQTVNQLTLAGLQKVFGDQPQTASDE